MQFRWGALLIKPRYSEQLPDRCCSPEVTHCCFSLTAGQICQAAGGAGQLQLHPCPARAPPCQHIARAELMWSQHRSLWLEMRKGLLWVSSVICSVTTGLAWPALSETLTSWKELKALHQFCKRSLEQNLKSDSTHRLRSSRQLSTSHQGLHTTPPIWELKVIT